MRASDALHRLPLSAAPKPATRTNRAHARTHVTSPCALLATHLCTSTGQLKARPIHSSRDTWSGKGSPTTGATQQRWCEAVRGAQRSATGCRGERLVLPAALPLFTLTCSSNRHMAGRHEHTLCKNMAGMHLMQAVDQTLHTEAG